MPDNLCDAAGFGEWGKRRVFELALTQDSAPCRIRGSDREWRGGRSHRPSSGPPGRIVGAGRSAGCPSPRPRRSTAPPTSAERSRRSWRPACRVRIRATCTMQNSRSPRTHCRSLARIRRSALPCWVNEQAQKRAIIHLDMDCFYAAVEVKHKPELRGKPLGIGGPPNSRSVLCTASYEARKFGIHSGMPMRAALRLCSHAVVVKSDFEAYSKYSRLVTEVI